MTRWRQHEEEHGQERGGRTERSVYEVGEAGRDSRAVDGAQGGWQDNILRKERRT